MTFMGSRNILLYSKDHFELTGNEVNNKGLNIMLQVKSFASKSNSKLSNKVIVVSDCRLLINIFLNKPSSKMADHVSDVTWCWIGLNWS